MKNALYWERVDNGKVHCHLCPHECRISNGQVGICRVRKNNHGMLFTLNYGKLSGIALDPIEKKPLYHFCPGQDILSVGSVGCNLDCGFCQNWQSVQGAGETREVSPGQLVDLAKGRPDNCGIAFTYTEPLMWYEFVLDTAKLAQEQGAKTVLVTNGFCNPKPWHELLPFIDAVNIDLKGWTQEFYRENCKGMLEPVLENIASGVGKVHVEVTTLLIQGHNTSQEDIAQLSRFLAELNPNIPLHLSRYHPARNWKQPATDPDLIEDLAQVARKELNFVYTGNLPGSWQVSTLCPKCRHLLISRGARVKTDTQQGKCPCCEYQTNIQECNKE